MQAIKISGIFEHEGKRYGLACVIGEEAYVDSLGPLQCDALPEIVMNARELRIAARSLDALARSYEDSQSELAAGRGLPEAVTIA